MWYDLTRDMTPPHVWHVWHVWHDSFIRGVQLIYWLYVRVCVCVCEYVGVCTCVCMYGRVCTFVCKYTRAFKQVYLHAYIHTYTHTHAHMHLLMHASTCAFFQCICVHTYIHYIHADTFETKQWQSKCLVQPGVYKGSCGISLPSGTTNKSKETYKYQKRPVQKTYAYEKRYWFSVGAQVCGRLLIYIRDLTILCVGLLQLKFFLFNSHERQISERERRYVSSSFIYIHISLTRLLLVFF